MKTNYPNLELLEYKTMLLIEQDEKVKEKLQNYWKDKPFKTKKLNPDLVVEVFLQTWSDTCLGFDVDDEGNAMWGGQAFTDAYTTVFKERYTDTYYVFFDSRICYKVEDANEVFLEDLRHHHLKPLSDAKRYY